MTRDEYRKATMKENVNGVLGEFINKNKDYVIEVYICDGVSDSIIGRIFVSLDRSFATKEDECVLEWDTGNSLFNRFTFQYDDIMACFEEWCEPDMKNIGQTVVIILKNGTKYCFECVGIRAK